MIYQIYGYYNRELQAIHHTISSIDEQTLNNELQFLHASPHCETIKDFLQHLWVEWRNLENLPVSDPYVIARMGHSDYIEPIKR